MCCGTRTCIINADGMCWCGQRWDGKKMCFPKLDASPCANAKGLQTQHMPDGAGPTDVHKA
jgi:hypothetical protein